VLSFLLDEHLSPIIAAEIAARRSEIPIVALRNWEEGAYLGADDATILVAAHAEQRTFVTYDLRTIPPLLRMWSESGTAHGGVVFVDAQTLAPNDIGGLLRALVSLWDVAGDLDWTDRVAFLRR